MPRGELSKIRAVIFDLDGVVLDTEPIYRAAWQRAASELGYRITDEMYLRLVGRTNKDCMGILQGIFGADFPWADFDLRWQKHWLDHLGNNQIPKKPGVEELLSFLEQHQLPRAIATSTYQKEALLSLGELSGRFAAIVTGDQVSSGKPAPDIFLAAAVRLGVPPERCLVLEDSEPGILAASAALMPSIMLPDLKPPTEEVRALALLVCASLFEVKELLGRWWK